MRTNRLELSVIVWWRKSESQSGLFWFKCEVLLCHRRLEKRGLWSRDGTSWWECRWSGEHSNRRFPFVLPSPIDWVISGGLRRRQRHWKNPLLWAPRLKWSMMKSPAAIVLKLANLLKLTCPKETKWQERQHLVKNWRLWAFVRLTQMLENLVEPIWRRTFHDLSSTR